MVFEAKWYNRKFTVNPSLNYDKLFLTASFFSILFQDAFIGFGGNVVREKVKQGAKWFVTDFQDLIQELEKQWP